MRYKKIIPLIVLLILLIGIVGCLPSGRYARNDEIIADLRFKEIVEALKNQDSSTLKDMFSYNVLSEAANIDEDMNYLINFFKGNIISFDSSRSGSDSREGNKIISEIECKYTVTTSVDEYIVFYIERVVDTEDPNNVGLYMLQIIKLSDRKEQFDWGGEKTRCAGIYRPTE